MERNGEEQMADAIRSAALRGAALEGGQDGLRRSDEDENSSPLADGENDSCFSYSSRCSTFGSLIERFGISTSRISS
jgi:hypothetical protein